MLCHSIDCVSLLLSLIVIYCHWLLIVIYIYIIIVIHSIHHYSLFTINNNNIIIIITPHTRCVIKSQVAQHSTPASPRPSSSSCVVARQPWSCGLNVPPRPPPINRYRKLLSQVCCSCGIYTFFPEISTFFLKKNLIKRLSTRTVVQSTTNVKCCLSWLRYDNNSWISSMFLKNVWNFAFNFMIVSRYQGSNHCYKCHTSTNCCACLHSSIYSSTGLQSGIK